MAQHTVAGAASALDAEFADRLNVTPMSETVQVDVGGLYVDAVLIGWAELDDLAQVRFEDGSTKTVMKSQVERLDA